MKQCDARMYLQLMLIICITVPVYFRVIKTHKPLNQAVCCLAPHMCCLAHYVCCLAHYLCCFAHCVVLPSVCCPAHYVCCLSPLFIWPL